MKLLFDNFVLATINRLPEEKKEKLNALDLAKVFKTEPKDWKLIVKQVLHLSDTIETAILDLWYTNQELAAQRKTEYHDDQFAIGFVDNFLKEDSKIDTWPGDSLIRAKERIKLFQSREN
jgi:hypothetical protein